jgi:hypothetical protein
MTPEQAYTAEQEQREANYTIMEDWRSLGAIDAAFGDLPQYKNDAYLEGYIKAIKELKCDRTGRIQHYLPQQNFAFGWIDNPNPCCDEF